MLQPSHNSGGEGDITGGALAGRHDWRRKVRGRKKNTKKKGEGNTLESKTTIA